MKHFSPKQCIQNSSWTNDVLRCPCGQELAVRYMINKEVRIFCYDRFKKYKQKILKREDTQKITSGSDVLGNLDYKEWDDLLCSIRQSKANAQCLLEN